MPKGNKKRTRPKETHQAEFDLLYRRLRDRLLVDPEVRSLLSAFTVRFATNDNERLNEQEFKFVQCWIGDPTKAAELAGYADPEKSGADLMKVPAIRRVVEAKQTIVFREDSIRLLGAVKLLAAKVLGPPV